MPVKRMDAAVLVKKGRRGPGRPPYDSAETREMLMNTAEELFADLGVEGVSIRSINAAAGLAPAAVHYHFNSKDRLLEAVIHRRGDAVLQRISGLLDKLEASRRTPTVQDLVEAIAIPYRELLDREPVGGLRWQRLIARLVLSRDRHLVRLTAGPEGLDVRFFGALRRAFPDVPEQPLEAGWRIAISTLLQMLGNSDNRLVRGPGENSSEISKTYGDLLVEFVSSGFASLVAARRRVVKGKKRKVTVQSPSVRRATAGG